MYIKVFVIVILCYCVYNGHCLAIDVSNEDHIDINVTTIEINHITVRKIVPNDVIVGKCIGMCSIDYKDVKFENCEVLGDNNKHLEVKIHKTITLNEKSQWNCSFDLPIKSSQSAQPTHNVRKYFKLRLTTHKTEEITTEITTEYRVWIEIIIIILLILIIFGLLTYIFCYRRKVRAKTSREMWPSRSESPDAKVRYIKMPTQSSLKARQSTERESCIYEALDNIKEVNSDPRAPSLPSLDTLPRSTSTTSQLSATPVTTMQRSMTNDPGATKSGFFKGGKRKKKESKNDGKTMTRIKERPPMPLPSSSDDIYEDMKPPAQLPGTPYLGKLPPTPATNTPKVTPYFDRKLPSTPEEFVPVQDTIQKRQEKLNLSLNKTPKKPPVPIPYKTPPNMPIMQVSPSQIREAAQLKKKQWNGSQNLKHNFIPPSPVETSPYLRRAAVGAPGPSPRPPRPSKPKQPRPPPAAPSPVQMRPPPPQPQPTTIHISTLNADDSDEEWTYEELPKYDEQNLYNNI